MYSYPFFFSLIHFVSTGLAKWALGATAAHKFCCHIRPIKNPNTIPHSHFLYNKELLRTYQSQVPHNPAAVL